MRHGCGRRVPDQQVGDQGQLIEAVGIMGTEWGNPFFDPFRIIGAFIVAVGFVLFAIIVFATRETAARS